LVLFGSVAFFAAWRGWALMIPVGPPNDGNRRVLSSDS
jgi:hypothetical protein